MPEISHATIANRWRLGVENHTQANTGAYNAVEYGPNQAARDAEHDALKTGETEATITVETSAMEAAHDMDPAIIPEDAKQTGEIPVVEADGDTDTIQTAELHDFEQRIDDILATGQLDATLRVIDTEGVAQVLPVLDSEPISHLLEGIEEIGGRANVFVHTADGIAVLNVVEYSPDDPTEADVTPTGETPIVSSTIEESTETME